MSSREAVEYLSEEMAKKAIEIRNPDDLSALSLITYLPSIARSLAIIADSIEKEEDG